MATLGSLLDSLSARPDIAGTVVVSDEGLVVHSNLEPGPEADAVAALAATALRSLVPLGQALGHGELRQMVMEGESGATVLQRLPSGATLVVLASDQGDLGEVLFHLRQQLPSLSELV